jgi:predicted nucleic acid-binding protein
MSLVQAGSLTRLPELTIVDTTVWIDYFGGKANPHTEWLDRELGQQPLGLTDLILCEILQGIWRDSEFARVQKELSRFDLLITGGEELAVASAKNYRYLRSRGCTVRKTIDCLIATFCITEGHYLLHRDRDFEPFEKFLGLPRLCRHTRRNKTHTLSISRMPERNP